MNPEPLMDYVALLSAALGDRKIRARAEQRLTQVLAAARPLSASHGDHVLRPSSFGRCSLEFAAASHGMLDLPDVPRDQMTLDSGTLHGAWFAALLAGVIPEEYGVAVERPVVYRETPGNIDVLVLRRSDNATEVVEIKTTASGSALKPPDASKPYQCLQAACYAASPAIGPARCFTILTYGANVGSSRDGEPHPKMRADAYATADWKPRVDAEIDRLKALTKLPVEQVLADAATLADTTDAFRCRSCRFSACPRNQNPLARFAL